MNAQVQGAASSLARIRISVPLPVRQAEHGQARHLQLPKVAVVHIIAQKTLGSRVKTVLDKAADREKETQSDAEDLRRVHEMVARHTEPLPKMAR